MRDTKKENIERTTLEILELIKEMNSLLKRILKLVK
tara:strand:+ start:2554 stop:2661 length:108 start_codon:yes stop_codon:yes gene_type:complete